MRRTVVGMITCMLAAASASSALAADPPAAQSPDSTALMQVLTQAVNEHAAPGIVGLVVDRRGVMFSGAAGELDASSHTAMPVDAIFNIASMTKPVTSVAIMMLVEQGKVQLDAPVSTYLSGFDHLQVITTFNEADGTYQTRPAKRPMTVRHLLTHTSGLGYAFSNPVVARLLKDSSKSEWEIPLISDPGERWTYSASTRVLGLIVEKVSGMPLEDYLQAHIFVPLGMVDTSFAVPPAKRSRLATIYARNAAGGFDVQSVMPMPAPTVAAPPYRGDGGLYSTAHDYGQFIRMFLNGGELNGTRLLKQSTIAMMGSNQIGAVFVTQQPAANSQLTRPFPLGAGRDKFGLGFQISEPVNAGTVPRAGSLSWAGIFNTEFWIDPKSGLGGVLMMQLLPFYDEAAIHTLQAFEASAYSHAPGAPARLHSAPAAP